MVARVLVEHFNEFQSFNNVVPKHIKHKHLEEMKKKSEKVQFENKFVHELYFMTCSCVFVCD
jgi:hypothetical protein